MAPDNTQDNIPPSGEYISSLAQDRLGRLGGVVSSQPRKDTKRYSQFIRAMRLTLPIIALIIAAVVFVWTSKDSEPIISAPPPEQEHPAIGKNELVNPRFESMDRKNQPVTITAERAVQGEEDEDLLILEKPVADIGLESGAWLALTAQVGTYKEEGQMLMLNGNVTIFHDLGYQLETQELRIDLANSSAVSETDVYIQGPIGTIKAKGLNGDNMNGKLVFAGPAQMVIHDPGSTNLERLQ